MSELEDLLALEERKFRKVTLWFHSEKTKLYGEVWMPTHVEDPLKRIVIMVHPHPKEGGNMKNLVIASIAESLIQKGISTFLFNMRGAKPSKGKPGTGSEDIKDVVNAINRVKTLGFEKIGLCGYSFGATIALAASTETQINALAVISPKKTVKEVNLEVDEKCSKICLPTIIICGSEENMEDLNCIKEIYSKIPSTNKMLDVINGANHEFYGFTGKLCNKVTDFFETNL
ncbi:MAG: alpha/beta fold hydrolase [Candidatus Odinarchaeota archaeon]|nr:alpha/beta fold hydrolase [Candidatus Odinarchaeota archaeon]